MGGRAGAGQSPVGTGEAPSQACLHGAPDHSSPGGPARTRAPARPVAVWRGATLRCGTEERRGAIEAKPRGVPHADPRGKDCPGGLRRRRPRRAAASRGPCPGILAVTRGSDQRPGHQRLGLLWRCAGASVSRGRAVRARTGAVCLGEEACYPRAWRPRKGERVCDDSRASSRSGRGGPNQAVRRSRSELCEGATDLPPNPLRGCSLGRAGGDAWHSESCEDGDTLSS